MFLRLDSPHFVPLRSPLIQMVFGENGASVQTVMIGGRIVFNDGKLLSLDEVSLRRQAQEAAHRLDDANSGTFRVSGHGRATGRRVLRGAGVPGHTLPRKLRMACEG